MKNSNVLQASTIEIISSMQQIVQQLDDERYSLPVIQLSGATIGQHTRHTVEFFQCLLEQYQNGMINYDFRRRNREIENNLGAAKAALDEINLLTRETFPDKPLTLKSSFSHHKINASAATSFHREWIYALEHAIHHMAIIKIALKIIAPEILIPDNFGVAPSTIKYRQQQCAQ